MREFHLIVEKKADTAITLYSEGKLQRLQSINFLPLGTKFKIKISEYNPEKEEALKRSLAQNAYYHLLLDIICDHTGDDHNDLHKELKARFLSKPFILGDREYLELGSTAKLDTKQFGDFLEKVFKFASEHYSLVLPEPKY